ncbi:MAG TPA: sulfatase [Acidimicrobiia bacterium]|nr:sulfatase [Acidimicrobiia bacterium]
MRALLRPRCLLVVFATLGVVLGAVPAAGAATATSVPQAAPGKKPNIVFILTDDLDLTSYLDPSRFPKVNSLLVDKGTTLSNYFVTDSLCCPSRSSTLRGQYVHEHGVLGNVGPHGGYQQFHGNGDEKSTVATWLHDAGYRTGLLGKYLNGYPQTVDPAFVPPGWDEWDSPTSGGNPYSEYNYRLNENGKLVRYGSSPDDYLVDALSRKSSEFIQQKSDKPSFLYVAPYVPHLPATPAPRYADAFPGVQAPRTPSFNQADMSAEPQWLQNRPLLGNQQISTIDQVYRRRLQSMLGVEDMVQNVVDALQKTGQLDNTYIVFTSDNGFHLGQHRLPPGKQTAFEEDIHVPLIVRGPGVPQGKMVDDFAMNIDFAPTFAALAGAKTPGFVNGQSLVPELHGKKPEHERKDVLVEHYAEGGKKQKRQGQARQTAALTAKDPDNDTNPPDAGTPATGPSAPVVRRGQFPGVAIPEYAALRTERYTYVEYVTGERQLYDLRADPDELHNIVSTADPKLAQDLAKQLSALKTCKGGGCRAADRG